MSEWSIVPNATAPAATGGSQWSIVPDKAPAPPPQDNTLIGSMNGLPGLLLRAFPDMMKGVTDPKQALKNRGGAVVQAGRELGQSAKQLGMAGGEMVGLVSPESYAGYTRDVENQRREYDQSPAGQDKYAGLLKTGVESTPYLALGPVLGGELGLLSQMGRGAALTGAIEGSRFVPEGESRTLNTLKGMTFGAAAPLIEPALGLTADAIVGAGNVTMRDIGRALNPSNLRPSRLMENFATSPLSNEQLLRNLEVTQGTGTGLGEVIGSPTAKRVQENILTKIPFSGANRSMQETGGEILTRGDNILEGYRNDVPHEDVTNQIGQALEDAATTHTNQKNALYRAANTIADRVGLRLQLPRFTEIVNRHLNALESTNMLQFEPEARSLIQRLRNYQNPTRVETSTSAIVDASGRPVSQVVTETPPSLSEANILAGKFNQLANRYGGSQNISERNAARVFGDIGRALKTDIRQSVYNSGSRELINAFRQAERNYARNYSEFLDKDILKYTAQDHPAENVLTTFIKTSNTADKADQLAKLMDKLTPVQQDLVRYGYFSRALEGPEDMRVVNPNKLSTLWRKLGTRQKQVLVPDAAQRRNLDNYSSLVGMNQKAVNIMWNPATGQMNMDAITAITALHPIKAIPEMIGGRVGNNLLTNQQTRENVVNSIIRRRQGNP